MSLAERFQKMDLSHGAIVVGAKIYLHDARVTGAMTLPPWR
jgi:hypothetical protein